MSLGASAASTTGTRLARGAGRVIVQHMGVRAGRLDVRTHSGVPPFGQRRDGDDKLRDDSDRREDREQPMSLERPLRRIAHVCVGYG